MYRFLIIVSRFIQFSTIVAEQINRETAFAEMVG